jgi:hypothetical protein
MTESLAGDPHEQRAPTRLRARLIYAWAAFRRGDGFWENPFEDSPYEAILLRPKTSNEHSTTGGEAK